jgi:hypothetical protein
MRLLNFFFSIYLILPAALGPGIYSASNKNEYRKHKNNKVLGSRVRVGIPVGSIFFHISIKFRPPLGPEAHSPGDKATRA